MNPKISIIINTYNKEDSIARTLNSIINQTLTNIEIIVIDNMSTDQTVDIVSEYANKDNRITFVKNTENMLLYLSRIKGLQLAKGDFIAFCDADDFYIVDAMQTLYDSALKYHADLITSNVCPVFCYPFKEYDLAIEDLGQTALLLGGSLFSKKLIEESLKHLPKNIKFTHGEDWFLRAIIYYFAKKRVHIENNLYQWDRSGNSETTIFSNERYRQVIKDYKIMIDHLIQFYQNTPYFKICDALIYNYLVRGCFTFWGYLDSNNIETMIAIFEEESSLNMKHCLMKYLTMNSILYDINFFYRDQEWYKNKLIDATIVLSSRQLLGILVGRLKKRLRHLIKRI